VQTTLLMRWIYGCREGNRADREPLGELVGAPPHERDRISFEGTKAHRLPSALAVEHVDGAERKTRNHPAGFGHDDRVQSFLSEMLHDGAVVR
jgi:hypothetical protein